MNQDDIFFKKEGDRYFQRNKKSVASLDSRQSPVIRMIERYGLSPKKVLDVGASNGYMLDAICRFSGAQGVGIEPSAHAVKDAKKQYPKLRLIRGLSSAIPLKETFDLVIVNYVLHWVSRENLLTSVAEIDRMVADGGYLIIGDFLPDYPIKNHYHHLKKGVFTYKFDYSTIFSSTSLYTVISKMTYDHDDRTKHTTAGVHHDNRSVCTLLRKSLSEFYAAGPR